MFFKFSLKKQTDIKLPDKYLEELASYERIRYKTYRFDS